MGKPNKTGINWKNQNEVNRYYRERRRKNTGIDNKAIKNVRIKRKIEFVELLNGECVKCSENDIRVLTFHHINKRNEKDSRLWWTRTNHFRDQILKDKIMLLCHNCHHKLHNPNGYLEYRQNMRSRNFENY